jgi:hypothetical protein
MAWKNLLLIIFRVDAISTLKIESLGSSEPGLSNAVPVIYFPGALIYSAGFNINQNLKKKIFLNNGMFEFFS